jgi:hypothetical protein
MNILKSIPTIKFIEDHIRYYSIIKFKDNKEIEGIIKSFINDFINFENNISIKRSDIKLIICEPIN